MKQSNYVKIFKALSNQQRLEIFQMIHKECCETGNPVREDKINVKGGACCPVMGSIDKAFTRICGCMNLSRSTISHHLKELQHAGLIICERDGQMIRCRVNEDALSSVRDFLK